jgi:hypothetical protein
MHLPESWVAVFWWHPLDILLYTILYLHKKKHYFHNNNELFYLRKAKSKDGSALHGSTTISNQVKKDPLQGSRSNYEGEVAQLGCSDVSTCTYPAPRTSGQIIEAVSFVLPNKFS